MLELVIVMNIFMINRLYISSPFAVSGFSVLSQPLYGGYRFLNDLLDSQVLVDIIGEDTERGKRYTDLANVEMEKNTG